MALTFFVTVRLIFGLNFHSTVKSITSLLTLLKFTFLFAMSQLWLCKILPHGQSNTRFYGAVCGDEDSLCSLGVDGSSGEKAGQLGDPCSLPCRDPQTLSAQ